MRFWMATSDPEDDGHRWYDPAIDAANPPAAGFIRVVTLMAKGARVQNVVKLRHVFINRVDIPLEPDMKICDLEELAGNDTDNTHNTVFTDSRDVRFLGGGASVVKRDTLATAHDGKTVYIAYCPK